MIIILGIHSNSSILGNLSNENVAFYTLKRFGLGAVGLLLWFLPFHMSDFCLGSLLGLVLSVYEKYQLIIFCECATGTKLATALHTFLYYMACPSVLT